MAPTGMVAMVEITMVSDSQGWLVMVSMMVGNGHGLVTVMAW